MTFDLKKFVLSAVDETKIITPRLNDWLVKHGDDEVSEEVADLIYKQMVTKPRFRGGSFSSSSAGACLRKQVLMYLNMPQGVSTDARLQNIFNDGKWRHMRWQAMLLEAGILDRMEYSLPWPAKRSVGTMDGYGIVPDDHPRVEWRGLSFGFELKGVNTYLYSQYEKRARPTDTHMRQVHRYFLSSGVDLFSVVYEDKSTQAWTEWVIEPNEELIEEQREELDLLNEAIDYEKLPKMLSACKSGVGAEWNSCPYAGANGICPTSGVWPADSLLKKVNER